MLREHFMASNGMASMDMCSDQTSNSLISVHQCHPWISNADTHCQDPDPKSHRSSCNTSYHFAASRTVTPRVPPYLARDRLRILAHVYDSVASIHMIENPGRHG